MNIYHHQAAVEPWVRKNPDHPGWPKSIPRWSTRAQNRNQNFGSRDHAARLDTCRDGIHNV